MSAQTSYNFAIPLGVAGSLFDISPYRIDSRLNGERTAGKLKFGMGAVRGANPGFDVVVPVAASAPALFEGVTMTGFTNEQNMGGEVIVHPMQTVGVLRWGKCWVRVPDGVTPEYGQRLYLIRNGENAGMFTNVATGNIEIHGRFVGGLGTGSVAPVEIFNQSNE